MSFFALWQNNSGGYYELSYNLTQHVIVEADSLDEANEKLAKLGAIPPSTIHNDDPDDYYGFTYSDDSCPCCGPRWNEFSNWNETDKPTVHGQELNFDKLDEVPEEERNNYPENRDWFRFDEDYDNREIVTIHYKNGQSKAYRIERMW